MNRTWEGWVTRSVFGCPAPGEVGGGAGPDVLTADEFVQVLNGGAFKERHLLGGLGQPDNLERDHPPHRPPHARRRVRARGTECVCACETLNLRPQPVRSPSPAAPVSPPRA